MSMDWSSIATAVSAPLALIIIGWMGVASTRALRRDIGQVATVVREVDAAVNGRTPRGTSTVSDDVTEILARQRRDTAEGEDEALLPMMRRLVMRFDLLSEQLRDPQR